MRAGSHTIAKETVVDRVVRTLLGGAEPADHEQLVAEARERYDDSTPFAGTLAQHVLGHPRDLRAREALLILCLARPALAREQGLEGAEEGRRLASLLVIAGQPERADRLLELLYRRYPGDAELEAERISSARRTGSVEELVERFLNRSEELAASGRPDDAVRWLRKALLLVPGRRDIAARIRDLTRGSAGGWRVLRRVALGLLLAGLAGSAVWRERQVSLLYQHLPEARAGDRASLEQRLAALDALMAVHPIWHGTLEARRQRIELNLELEALRWNEALERTRDADEELTRSLAAAEDARQRARTAVLDEDLEQAVAELEQALRSAPADWEHAVQVRRDLAAVRAQLVRGR